MTGERRHGQPGMVNDQTMDLCLIMNAFAHFGVKRLNLSANERLVKTFLWDDDLIERKRRCVQTLKHPERSDLASWRITAFIISDGSRFGGPWLAGWALDRLCNPDGVS